MSTELNFKQLIKKHRYNATTLAVDLNVTRYSTMSWIKGKTTPNVETLNTISELLNEPVETVVKALMACKGK